MRSPIRTLTVLFGLAILAGCERSPVGPERLGPSTVPQRTLAASVQPRISAGPFHTCALRSTGLIECWGVNYVGAVSGTPEDPATPAFATRAGSFVQISVGEFHSCALRSDGVIECWGNSSNGQAPATRQAPGGLRYTQVNSGASHTCAVRSDGIIECWGAGATDTGVWPHYGQAPPMRESLSGVGYTSLSAGDYHTCALREDGVVECWGEGTHPFFSFGQAPPVKEPPTSLTYTQVTAGALHSCALRSDGVIECWGGWNGNFYGEAPATRSAQEGRFTQASAASEHTCAVREDGVIECWGAGATNSGVWPHYGQAPPTREPPAGLHYTQVSGADTHTCGLRSDGLVECWGANWFGEARSDQRIQFTSPPPSPAQPGGSYAVSATSTSGLAVSFTSLTPAVCSVSASTVSLEAEGTCTIAADQPGNGAYLPAPQVTQSVEVLTSYPFSGFLPPVHGEGLNLVKAGRAVPIKFSLGGDFGLKIFAEGYPKSVPLARSGCTSEGGDVPTISAGQSGLSYDAATDQYTYVWATKKEWAGTCRQLQMQLSDGNTYTLDFSVTR